jgi:signal transduction histidine kinase
MAKRQTAEVRWGRQLSGLSTERPDRTALLQCRAGKAWLLLLVLILFSSLAGGYALYRSNLHWFETNKSEETATALRLVEAMVANYTDIRSALQADDAPVPATFRAHAIDRFNAARDSDHQLQMDWLGIPGREIATAPQDETTATAIREAARTGRSAPRSEWLPRNGELMFRTIAPSIASQQACVDCHNLYVADGDPWQLGDVMGAFVIDIPADGFLSAARRDAAVSGGVLFLVLATVSGLILFLQHRRQQAEILASANAEQARSASEGRRIAEAASRAKSRFLALMSHELRTPLNAILGFSEVMTRETMGPIPARYGDYAQDIHKSGQHLLTVISDILDLARAESGHLRLSTQEITLEEAVGPCLRLIRPRAEQQKISVAAKLPKDLRLDADLTKLRQAVLNLLSNAVKFTPEGGRILVTAELRDDGALAIAITDSGIGIKPEEIPQALTPFERLEAAEQIEGTGLGLPLAKVLTELHGGSLELEGLAEGGTRVTLVLPPERVCKDAREEDAAEAGPVSGGVEPRMAAMPER